MKLQARSAVYEWRSDDDASIHVTLEPFEFEGELVDTSVRLDGIEGLPADLRNAARKVFAFPVNPQDGYIDGSIYLRARHWNIDVTRLVFGAADGDVVHVRIIGVGMNESTPAGALFALDMGVRVDLPLGDQALLGHVQHAIRALQATSSKDVGRVVAAVKSHLVYRSDHARAAYLAAELLAKK